MHLFSFYYPQVIELQNEKMESMDMERINMQAKFREELDKASRAMRQEVERMREVIRPWRGEKYKIFPNVICMVLIDLSKK